MILGIDPATQTGLALITILDKDEGIIRIDNLLLMDVRKKKSEKMVDEEFYHRYYGEFNEFINYYKSDIEQSSMESSRRVMRGAHVVEKLAGIRAVMRAILGRYRIPNTLYMPTTIKKRIGGSGKADKKVIINSVRKLTDDASLKELLKDDNIADALAVAITHGIVNYGLKNPTENLLF